MNRPDGDPARPYTVVPGLHIFEPPSAERRSPIADTYSVVWWDPHALHLGATSSFGLRRDDLIVKDGDMFAVDDRMADYERWRDERRATAEAARRPSVRLETATAWAAAAAQSGVAAELADAATIDILEIAGAARRPRGARFGTLVHAVLATVPLDADAETVRRTAETQGRILASPSEEIVAASAVVIAVLAHQLMDRVRAAAVVRRETPLSWLQKDGTLIEGVLDLAFDEGDRTVVVDFKTDHELSAGEARYRAQLQQYLNAVTNVTGRTATGVLFRI